MNFLYRFPWFYLKLFNIFCYEASCKAQVQAQDLEFGIEQSSKKKTYSARFIRIDIFISDWNRIFFFFFLKYEGAIFCLPRSFWFENLQKFENSLESKHKIIRSLKSFKTWRMKVNWKRLIILLPKPKLLNNYWRLFRSQVCLTLFFIFFFPNFNIV